MSMPKVTILKRCVWNDGSVFMGCFSVFFLIFFRIESMASITFYYYRLGRVLIIKTYHKYFQNPPNKRVRCFRPEQFLWVQPQNTKTTFKHRHNLTHRCRAWISSLLSPKWNWNPFNSSFVSNDRDRIIRNRRDDGDDDCLDFLLCSSNLAMKLTVDVCIYIYWMNICSSVYKAKFYCK